MSIEPIHVRFLCLTYAFADFFYSFGWLQSVFATFDDRKLHRKSSKEFKEQSEKKALLFGHIERNIGQALFRVGSALRLVVRVMTMRGFRSAVRLLTSNPLLSDYSAVKLERIDADGPTT